jgi:hypothetical protein
MIIMLFICKLLVFIMHRTFIWITVPPENDLDIIPMYGLQAEAG